MLILPPIPKWQWRTPSQAQPKNYFGHENHTRFKITACLNDGYPVWTGWFDDRNDAEAFYYAVVIGTIEQQPALWSLPVPMWVPAMGEQLSYYFATTTYLTNTATTSYTTPVDWGPVNTIECIGGAGGGAGGYSGGGGGAGGGGGGYSKGAVTALGGNVTIAIQIGTGGAGGGTNGGTGGVGGDTYFNGASLAASSVGAQGGRGGGPYQSGNSAVAGGLAANGIGSTKYSGGSSSGGSIGGGGGGGAAGPNGVGGNAASAGTSGGAGGTADAGFGGAGGAGGPSGTSGTAGGTGTEYTSVLGCGGGGGGGGGDGPGPGASGGNYGGGGGGGGQTNGGNREGARGIQGFIVITYTPSFSTFFMMFQ